MLLQPKSSQYRRPYHQYRCIMSHSARGAYGWKHHASGTTFSTNGTESFWKLFKESVNSTHIHIGQTNLDRYLGEFSFRSNFRQVRNAVTVGALITLESNFRTAADQLGQRRAINSCNRPLFAASERLNILIILPDSIFRFDNI
jgi:hypothetical protein